MASGKSVMQIWKEEGFKIKLTHKYKGEYAYEVVYKGKKYIIDIYELRTFWSVMVDTADGKAVLPKRTTNRKGRALMVAMEAIKKHLGLTT